MVWERIEVDHEWRDVSSHMAKEAANALSLCSGGEIEPKELQVRNRRERDREHKASVRERKS